MVILPYYSKKAMKYPYTIKDIAKALNLSASTVSRALRDSYEISADTKKIVLEYAEQVNYQANPIARSLKERRSYSIGIIVSEIANNFFSQIINGVESVAYDRNYQVIISQTHESSNREKLNVEYLSSRSIDGLLITLSSETHDLSYLKKLYEQGFPIVFFDRVPNDFDTYKITVDNKQGAYQATTSLIQKGCTRIAHLANSANLSITTERLDGYKQALAENGIPFNIDLVEYCNYGGLHHEEVKRAVSALAKHPVDAVFMSGDKLTTGFLQAVKEGKHKKMDNIPLAGFTNSNVVNIFSSPLLAVRQPAFEMGKIATEHLIKMIESKYPISEFETITLPTELVEHS